MMKIDTRAGGWLFAISLAAVAACSDSPGGGGDQADGGTPNPTTDAGVAVDGAAPSDGSMVTSPDGSPPPRLDGGTDAPPPKPVPPCPVGDGGGAVGVWEDVSPAAFKNPSNMETWSVAVNPVDGSVFASAGNVTNGGNQGTGVYKSTDCGATWKKISTGAHGTDLDTGDPWALLIDPVASDTMYIDNGYGDVTTLFQSTNGGVDWQPMNIDPCGVTAPAFAQAVSIDPTNHQHVALTFHETCGAATKACSVAVPTTPMCLAQTTDGGKTWSYVNGPTAAQGVTGWQESASLQILDANTYLLLTPQNGGWLTRDGGATWTQKIATYNIYGSYAGSAHIGPDGTIYVGVANDGIYESHADASHLAGDVWTKLAGSPSASGSTAIADDGVSLYASSAGHAPQPVFYAPLSNPTTWTNMPAPSDPMNANELAYDSARHMLYAASIGAGLWRLRTR